MAVVGTAKQRQQGRGGHVSAGGKRTRERAYLVQVDDPNDGTVTVLNAGGLPVIGDVFSELDTNIVCTDLIPEPLAGTRLWWVVTAIYSTEYESLDQVLSEPPDVDFPSEPGEEPVIGQSASTYPPLEPGGESDPTKIGVWFKTGKGIVNSAGNIYDPPATRRKVTPLVRVTRNESASAFDIVRKLRYENTVNSSPWNGLTSRQAFLRLYTAKAMYFIPPKYNLTRLLYWQVTYEFALKYETWDLVLPDAGPYYLVYEEDVTQSDGTKLHRTYGPPLRRQFKDDQGNPRIGLLDHKTDGRPGLPLGNNSDGTQKDVQYNRWRDNREEDYGPLNVNLSLDIKSLFASPRGFKPLPDPSKTPIAVA